MKRYTVVPYPSYPGNFEEHPNGEWLKVEDLLKELSAIFWELVLIGQTIPASNTKGIEHLNRAFERISTLKEGLE